MPMPAVMNTTLYAGVVSVPNTFSASQLVRSGDRNAPALMPM